MGARSFRRCISCRGSGLKHELLRFVITERGLQWDCAQKLPGRGAYLHRSHACAARAGEVKLWRHAFREGTANLGIRIEEIGQVISDIRGEIERRETEA